MADALLKSYLAGYLDGEGCFTISKDSVRLECVNTYYPVLQILKNEYGGSIRERSPAKGRKTYHWYVGGEGAVTACKDLYPFLIEKRDQASCLIQYRNYPPHSAMRNYLLTRNRRLKRLDQARA